MFWNFYRTPEALRDLKKIEENIQLCMQYFQLLDGVLSRSPFLAGGSLTLADIPAGTLLYRYFKLDIPHPDVPNVTAWYKRLQLHPAYREHVMLPFDELRSRLSF